MVLRESVMIVLAGIAAAIPLAWFGTTLLESQLFGLSPHHPQTTLFATAALVLATIVAGYLPARRASRVDPAVALGYE